MAVDQKAYRRYHATVERALTLFDVNSDWADYIAFLSRLLKALDTSRPDELTDLPCKTRIALALARCLQPHLPSGVHQKALNVYAQVFSIVGLEGLARDLSLYLPGLSHTLAFANLATRPLVLDLYEDHVLRLKSVTLRPALKALILSLLPVIEEESSEDFDRCLRTFDSLRTSLATHNEESFFWQTLFTASVANPLRRAGVLVYLNHYLPRLTSAGDLNAPSATHVDPARAANSDVIITPEPGLLVRCFATGLRDEQPLVQRGFLDLLVSHLPLNSSILQSDAYTKDLDVLVTAAIMIVLRRDMGLNRRLWAWLTGSDGKTNMQVASPHEDKARLSDKKHDYFARFGMSSTIRSIQSQMNNKTTSPTQRTLPFRIVLSLLDRQEIGTPVVKTSLASMMRHLMSYQSSAPSQDAFDEVFRSASSLFDGIESITLFECLSSLTETDETDLLMFIATNFNLEQVDMAHGYLCQLGSAVTTKIQAGSEAQSSWIMLLNTLIATIPQPNLSAKQSLQKSWDQLLRGVADTMSSMLSVVQDASLLSRLCTSFESLLTASNTLTVVLDGRMIPTLDRVIREWDKDSPDSFTTLDTCTRILEHILQRLSELDQATEQVCLACLPALVQNLWAFLGTSTPQCHVVTVEHLWRLHEATLEHKVVESAVLQQLGSPEGAYPERSQVERFGVLHHHTKTIKRANEDSVPDMLQTASLRILDQTAGEERGEPGVNWLLSLQSIAPLLALVLEPQFGDLQKVALTLYRVRKLVRVLYLSEDHWRLFSSSPELSLVRSFCISLIQKQATDHSAMAHDAFILLRVLYDNRSGNVPPEELVSLLVDMLSDSSDSSKQEEVLDSLLAVLNDRSLLPASLINVLLQGISTVPIDERLDKWITLLCNFLPNHAALLPSLLKTTNSFCKRIEQAFDDLRSVFGNIKQMTNSQSPERSIINLLSGLEYILARAHQQILQDTVGKGISGDSVSSRSKANDHLTVVLCMQDAIRICTKLWSWKSMSRTDSPKASRAIAGDVKSFQYSAVKLRSRSRKILENLIEAEPQECLETLIGIWTTREQDQVLELLQTLNGARPRLMMPVVFNAINSRTSAGSFTESRKSSLSIQMNPMDLMMFLSQYTSALEDDMLEEIWTDCANFLRDVLTNPMAHRQILIRMLRYCALLSQKMENTSFGEESRMRRELADICTRLFTAIFTIKPSGFDGGSASIDHKLTNGQSKLTATGATEADNMLAALVETLPILGSVMSQTDRLNTIYSGIATHITTPSLHARTFPSNLTKDHLEIVRIMSTAPGSIKVWKKDLTDSFNNPRIFQSPLELVKKGWLPLIKQMCISDKTMVVECLARIAPPAAAGMMFGVGATAARNEADKRTQLELRRVATLILSCETDAFVAQLPQIFQKIEELFGATIESSPSLATRGDVYLVIRALFLKINHSNLNPLWPILDQELQEFCRDILAGSESKYHDGSKLEGIKLLDLLLLLRPDEFQLHEWLFVTDTIDAIHPSMNIQPTSFADEIAPKLNTDGSHFEASSNSGAMAREPWMYGSDSLRGRDIETVLAEFFGQLSIRVFEDLYSLLPVDEEACKDDLLADIFSDLMA